MLEADFAEGAFAETRVVIWGLGLMGGSLALALRGKCARLVGIDRDARTVEAAQARGVVDAAYTDPRAALAEADLIVLAAPVRAILSMLQALPGLAPRPAVVMDLGSTKADILEAMAQMPEGWQPVGGHPMCGKEKSSLEHAEAALYHGATFALAAPPRTGERARQMAEALARAVEACPLWVDPQAHDRWVAATSHLPFLLASALAGSTPEESAPMIGTGFRSATRLASSSPEMMVDILATNRENVRAALGRFRAQLERYEELLAAGDYAALAEQFQYAAEHLRHFEKPQQ